jgi:uncharacterized membrane protein
MFILAKIVGIIVLVWFAITAKAQGEYWLRWVIVGLIGYWLTWIILYITLSMPIVPTFSALVMVYFIRKKLLHDSKKNKSNNQ